MLSCISEANKLLLALHKNRLDIPQLGSSYDQKSIFCCPVMAVDFSWQLGARAKVIRSHVFQQMEDTVRE